MNNRNSKNHAENVKNYQRRSKKVFGIMCDLEKDADVIKWFKSKKNYSGEVRKLIRKSLERRKRQNEASAKLREKRKENHICIFCGKLDDRTVSGKSLCINCFIKAQERQRARR